MSNALGIAVSERASLLVTNAAQPDLRLEAVFAGDREVVLTVTGLAGRSCEIEVSTDLSEWITLRALDNPTGVARLSDSPAPPGRAWFYRARLLP